MALTDAKHEGFFTTLGSSADKITSGKLAEVKDLWNKDVASGGNIKLLNDPTLGPLLYQMQQMQDELTYLRTEISTNKDKVSLAGGSATTLSFGEMITVPPKTKGGASTYNIIMTATKSGVSKTVTLALA